MSSNSQPLGALINEEFERLYSQLVEKKHTSEVDNLQNELSEVDRV